MVDFVELEKKCKQLQRKKMIKLIILIFVIILASLLVYVLIKLSKGVTVIDPVISQKVVIKKDVTSKKEKNISVLPIKKVKKIEKNISTLPKPIKIIKEKNISKHLVPMPILDIKIDFDNIKVLKEPKKLQPKSKPKKQEQNHSKQPHTISIKVPTKVSVLESKDITFTKAIQLAELYYNNGDYKNSIKWCKIAAKIDNNVEKVWKLYALNLEKIGKKQKAIKILKTYLKYKDSLELKFLLQRLIK